jgi:hypothetical protein
VKYLRSFALFWWNFIVGDDWRVALGIAVSLALTWLLVDAGANPWWFLPPAIVAVLAASLWRETHQSDE